MSLLKFRGKLSSGNIVQLSIFAAVIIVAFILPQLTSTIILTGISILMYISLSVSWTVFSGPTGYISLATAAFFGLGVYVSAFLGDYLPMPLLMLTGGIVAFIVAVLIGAITLRLRGVYFTIFTFGMVEFLNNLIHYLQLKITGRRGLTLSTVLSNTVIYYYLLGFLVIILVAAIIIKRSRFGKALVSIGESEDAASHVGINTTLYKILAFAISSFFIGAVGAAMAVRITYIDSGIAFSLLKSFLPVLMVVFGGMGSFAGPVVGAAIFAYLLELVRTNQVLSSYYSISIGAIMIIAILFLPEGLIGLGQRIFRKISGGKRRAEHADS
ncbi:MAG: branched-chain amino acid ABC transporter permease [Oscillospiraceae bacterium]|jgi:branched-chain amino acid transport system permease protein|nr:branched-chain amino acid ABC transporter permease [Oscillospiraceae bacterium]